MTADSGTESTPSLGGGASFARYLAGFALSLGGQAGQQVQILWPLTSTGIGAPIDPSLAVVTGQIFCSSTVRLAKRVVAPEGRVAAIRPRNSGVSVIGVFRVTVANIP